MRTPRDKPRPPRTRPRRRGLRAALLVGVAVIVLAVIAIAAVHMVLSSTIPARMVQKQLQRQTGLSVEVGGLAAGWFGSTTATDVRFGMPLADETFAVAPTLEIDHTALIPLVLGRPVEIERLRIDGLQLVARQDASGAWELARAIEAVQNTVAANAAGESESGGLERLPAIVISGASVRVVRPDQPDVTYDDIEFAGRHRGAALEWMFELTSPDLGTAKGAVAPTAAWPHEVHLAFDDLTRAIGPFAPDAPHPLAVDGTWTGRVAGGALRGRLQLASLAVGPVVATGDVEITTGDEGLKVSPDGLVVRTESVPEAVRLVGGAAVVGAAGIQLQGLRARTLGATATIDGSWSLDRGTVEVDGTWLAEAGAPVRHGGAVRASLQLPGEQPLELDVTATGRLRTATGRLSSRLVASASGSAWDDLVASVALPELRWTDSTGTIESGGLAAAVEVDEDVARLTRLDVPGATVNRAWARARLDGSAWEAHLALGDWTVERFVPDPMTLELQAAGDDRSIDFSHFDLDTGRTSLRATGRFDAEEQPPLRAAATLTIADASAEGEISGRAVAQLDVGGRLQPLDVAYQGELLVSKLPIGAGVIDEVRMPWRGEVVAELVTFEGRDFALLGGRWNLEGTYRPRSEALEIDLEGTSVELAEVVDLFTSSVETSGRLDTTLRLSATSLDVDSLVVDGEWSADAPRTRGLGADRARGRVSLRNASARFDDVRVESGEGHIEGDVRIDLNGSPRLVADATSTAWPVANARGRGRLALDGVLELSMALDGSDASGRLDLQTPLIVSDEEVGALDLQAGLSGRRLELQRIAGRLHGGMFEGQGIVPLDDVLGTRATLGWDDVSLDELAELAAPLTGLSGTSSGRLEVQQATDERALEPLVIRVDLDVVDGAYRGMDVDEGTVVAFAGANRIILEQARLGVAGGAIELWGRTSLHAGDRQVHLTGRAVDLQLDQIVHAADPAADPIVARLSARASVGGYVDAPHRAFGAGRVRIADADLGRVPVLENLYGLMRLDFSAPKPEGRGEVRFALEGDALKLTNISYFNRGTQVAGAVTLRDIWAGGDSPIDGLIVGSARPFADLNLPLTGDLDRFVQALQTDATSVRLGGTLADRQISVVPFAEVGSSVQRLLQAAVSE